MQRTVKKVVVYRCDICRSEYPSERAARACERKGIEPQAFKKGEWVRVRGPKRTCVNGHRYECRGSISRVLGPLPYDGEVFMKGFGIADNGLHRHFYEVPCACPTCGGRGGGQYPGELLAPER